MHKDESGEVRSSLRHKAQRRSSGAVVEPIERQARGRAGWSAYVEHTRSENMMRLRKLGSNAKLQVNHAKKTPMHQETTYYVILFRRQDGDLIGMAPIKAESEIAAVGEAQFLAQELAGAIVIGRSGDGSDADAIEIIFKTGEVPETLSDLWTV